MIESVTRAQLVAAAELALAECEVPVPAKLVAELRDVALTAKLISLDWVGYAEGNYDKPACGCLVGTARMRRGDPASPGPQRYGRDVEWEVGLEFIDAMAEVVGSDEFFDVLTVVDA